MLVLYVKKLNKTGKKNRTYASLDYCFKMCPGTVYTLSVIEKK